MNPLTALAAAATFLSVVPQAAADAASMFADSLRSSQTKAPDYVPDAMLVDSPW